MRGVAGDGRGITFGAVGLGVIRTCLGFCFASVASPVVIICVVLDSLLELPVMSIYLVGPRKMKCLKGKLLK